MYCMESGNLFNIWNIMLKYQYLAKMVHVLNFKEAFWGLTYMYIQDFSWENVAKNYFLITQPKHYVVGTQKNRLNETVLLSCQNIY